MKKYILRILLFAFLISACEPTTSSETAPMTDREMAEQAVKDFYTALDEERYDEAYQLLSSENRKKSIAETFFQNINTEETAQSYFQFHLISAKIISIEPFDGAVETERCKRFHVVLGQSVRKSISETELNLSESQLEEEVWVAVVKEGEDWKLNPYYYGLGKDSCNKFE